MKRLIIIIPLLYITLSCSEEIDLRSSGEHNERLVVEAIITDRADRPQKVVLSKSIPYFEEGLSPAVTGAIITISDGISETSFQEIEAGSGEYFAPIGYHGEEGKSYHLTIALKDGNVYEADADMPRNGFRLDEIDYAFAGDKTMGLDSLWTIAAWGKDMETTDYYYVTAGVNGSFYPFEMAEVTDDIYFNGNDVNGFPLATLMQYSQMRLSYGDCCKYLETGDVVTLEALTLTRDFYDFLMSLLLNGSFSAIPLFSPQPANCPTNIKGGDGNVSGYFAMCPVCSADVVVDDPFRPYYKRTAPGAI